MEVEEARTGFLTGARSGERMCARMVSCEKGGAELPSMGEGTDNKWVYVLHCIVERTASQPRVCRYNP